MRAPNVVTVSRCVAAALLAAACTAEPPIRLTAGRSDTVTVHSRRPVPLAVRTLDAAGHARDVRAAHYRREAGDAGAVSDDGRVTCTRQGDVAVRVAHRALSARLVVQCRPIRAFLMTRGIRLLVGGPSVEVPLAAVDVDGDAVLPIAGRAVVRDPRVASLDGLRVRPVAPGETAVEVDIGDCTTTVGVEVDERVASSVAMQPYQTFLAPELHLAAGEMRSWRIAPGPYELWLRSRPEAADSLVLAAYATNCAPIPTDPQRYRCIAREGAAVVVRHPRAAGRGRAVDGDLSIRRVPLERPAAASNAPAPRRKPPCLLRLAAPRS